MVYDAPRASRDDARSYLLSLTSGVMDEANRELRDPEAAELLERGERLMHDLAAADLRSFGIWQRWAHAYEALADGAAAARNRRARTARSYETMEELWQDAEAQALGASPHTIWDAHEHGRRRQIEGRIARRFGAESALLVNSGMSAIAVATSALRIGRGATILTGHQAQPETADYLTRYVAPAGVKIVRVPAGRAEPVLEALQTLRPHLALFETASTGPVSEVPSRIEAWFEASPETLFVIDNTVQSLLTPWFSMDRAPGRRLLVVEDASRYLCHRAMAGLLYGPAALLAPLRDLARASGQNLQERAFNSIRAAEVEHLGWKLARHAANVRVFAGELSDLPEIEVRLLGSDGDDEAVGALFTGGPGCLVFVRLRAMHEREAGHRRLLSRWQAHARKRGAWVPVRDGFGWSDTTARLFEPPGGGHPEARYLRVSVGIEPEAIVRDLARALGAAATEMSCPTV